MVKMKAARRAKDVRIEEVDAMEVKPHQVKIGSSLQESVVLTCMNT